MKMLLLFSFFFLLACQKTEDIRQYEEVSGTNKKVEVPTETKAAFSWKTPSHWAEEKGETMRLASFHPKSGDAFLLTLLQLPSNGGGILANAERWAGQLGIKLKPSAMQSFIDEAPKLSLENQVTGLVLDFSTLENSPQSSMLTAILQKPGLTLFVKMTGTKQVLRTEKAHFDEFVNSMTLLKEGQP